MSDRNPTAKNKAINGTRKNPKLDAPIPRIVTARE
jgi:hypothetical protein